MGMKSDMEKAITSAIHRYKKRKMVTEINAIAGEELPKAVSAAKSLIEILNSFGPGTTIRKNYAFETW